jgi:bifunctional non-homologous end joining protein LigD
MGSSKSWALTKGPSLDPRDRRLAVEVEDHPLDYGDFEGTIPQGEYGGGTVMLWDRGFWSTDDGGDPERALRKGDLKFTLAGEKLQGSWVLVRMRHDRERDRSSRNNWLLIKHRDGHEREGGDPMIDKDRSVASYAAAFAPALIVAMRNDKGGSSGLCEQAIVKAVESFQVREQDRWRLGAYKVREARP